MLIICPSVFAIQALLFSLTPLVGAESSLGRAVSPGWADNASEEQLKEWRMKGLEMQDELIKVTQEVTAKEYGKLMRKASCISPSVFYSIMLILPKRLALRREISTDESQLVKPLLSFMESNKLDFSSTFRILCDFKPSMIEASEDSGSTELQVLIKRILATTPYPELLDVTQATQELMAWLDKYAARIESERDEWGTDSDGERRKAARAANPRFILRQWLLEEVISRVERDVDSGKRVLAKVLQVSHFQHQKISRS